MQIKKRQLNDSESKKLSKKIKELEKINYLKINWIVISTLVLLTCLFAVHIYFYDKSNWSLISKFLVCLCPIIIWIYIENKVKIKKQSSKSLNQLKEIQLKKSIEIIEVEANRIIEFLEKEDEGILYLIETLDGESFYLWTEQYLIPENGNFPCNKFHIYFNNEFKYAIDEKIYCKSEKIDTIQISGDDKWSYFEKRGFPADLELEKQKFEDIIYALKSLED